MVGLGVAAGCWPVMAGSAAPVVGRRVWAGSAATGVAAATSAGCRCGVPVEPVVPAVPVSRVRSGWPGSIRVIRAAMAVRVVAAATAAMAAAAVCCWAAAGPVVSAARVVLVARAARGFPGLMVSILVMRAPMVAVAVPAGPAVPVVSAVLGVRAGRCSLIAPGTPALVVLVGPAGMRAPPVTAVLVRPGMPSRAMVVRVVAAGMRASPVPVVRAAGRAAAAPTARPVRRGLLRGSVVMVGLVVRVSRPPPLAVSAVPVVPVGMRARSVTGVPVVSAVAVRRAAMVLMRCRRVVPGLRAAAVVPVAVVAPGVSAGRSRVTVAAADSAVPVAPAVWAGRVPMVRSGVVPAATAPTAAPVVPVGSVGPAVTPPRVSTAVVVPVGPAGIPGRPVTAATAPMVMRTIPTVASVVTAGNRELPASVVSAVRWVRVVPVAARVPMAQTAG